MVILVPPIGFGANSYLLTEDGLHAACIDPSSPHVLKEAERHGLLVTHVFLTHAHFDHAGGVAAMQRCGAKVYLSRLDYEMSQDGELNLGPRFGAPVPPYTVDVLLDGEQELSEFFGTYLPTPGHTAGSACLICGDILFTGDTLFKGDVGRTDLPTGDEHALRHSLQSLARYAKEQDFTVFPGHGERTTLREEILRLSREGIC